MPLQVQHFVTGKPGFTAQLNELVDVVNALAEQLEQKADKRVTKTSTSQK